MDLNQTAAPGSQRRGVYGSAKPAFTVHRFKRTIILALNEEMAETLNGVLTAHEEANGGKVPPHLYEFTTQVQEALDQPPPDAGQKPAKLAPGRPRPLKKPAA